MLKSGTLRAKAELLKRRARAICAEMDDAWWRAVYEQQQLLTDHWEIHYADAQRGKAYWINWVTEEKRSTRPAEAAM